MYSWLCPLFGKKLEYLFISGNTFDGNLSYFLNSLSTSATTLDTLDASRLCGLPTTKKCPGDEYLGVPNVVKSESDGYSTDETQRWFYVGGATGFATGFCIDLELIANAEALNKYNQVMNFLLRVKRAKFVLDEARRWVWKVLNFLNESGTMTVNRKQRWLWELIASRINSILASAGLLFGSADIMQ
ncbi:leucine-rich repeat domain, L domain-like protein [Tanacetum coccineum]